MKGVGAWDFFHIFLETGFGWCCQKGKGFLCGPIHKGFEALVIALADGISSPFFNTQRVKALPPYWLTSQVIACVIAIVPMLKCSNDQCSICSICPMLNPSFYK